MLEAIQKPRLPLAPVRIIVPLEVTEVGVCVVEAIEVFGRFKTKEKYSIFERDRIERC